MEEELGTSTDQGVWGTRHCHRAKGGERSMKEGVVGQVQPVWCLFSLHLPLDADLHIQMSIRQFKHTCPKADLQSYPQSCSCCWLRPLSVSDLSCWVTRPLTLWSLWLLTHILHLVHPQILPVCIYVSSRLTIWSLFTAHQPLPWSKHIHLFLGSCTNLSIHLCLNTGRWCCITTWWRNGCCKILKSHHVSTYLLCSYSFSGFQSHSDENL